MAEAMTIAHDDPTVRVIDLGGDPVTIADDPDSGERFCLYCKAEVKPYVRIVILNSEEWDYADDDTAYCPTCDDSDLCRVEDAEDTLRERALDAEADYRYSAWKDGDRVSPW